MGGRWDSRDMGEVVCGVRGLVLGDERRGFDLGWSSDGEVWDRGSGDLKGTA